MAERLIAGEAYSVNPLKLLIGVFRGIAWRRLLGDSMVLRQHIHHRAYGLLDFRSGKGTCWCAFVSGFDCLRGRYCYATFIGKIVPWSLETACTGFGFFVLGYLAKSPGKTWFASITRPAWLPLWLVVTAAGTWLNVTIAHQRLDVYMNEYGWYPFTMMRVGRHRVGVGVVAVAGIPRADRCRQASEFTVAIHRQKFVHLLQSEPSGIAYRRRDPGSLRYSSQ